MIFVSDKTDLRVFFTIRSRINAILCTMNVKILKELPVISKYLVCFHALTGSDLPFSVFQ